MGNPSLLRALKFSSIFQSVVSDSVSSSDSDSDEGVEESSDDELEKESPTSGPSDPEKLNDVTLTAAESAVLFTVISPFTGPEGVKVTEWGQLVDLRGDGETSYTVKYDGSFYVDSRSKGKARRFQPAFSSVLDEILVQPSSNVNTEGVDCFFSVSITV